MQERKEYKLNLTQLQAKKLQQLLEMTTFANDVKLEEIPEVKAEIDERKEVIKSIKCMVNRCTIGCTEEDCNMCEFDTDISEIKVQQIAIKHIQGYKEVKEEIDRMKCDNPTTNYWKGFYKGAASVGELMEEKFDISEDKE